MADVNQISSSKNYRGRRKRMSIKIDMTPMVDLAFLLLTFFVISTTLQEPYVVKIEMPDESVAGPLVHETRVLNLLLGGEDKIYWYRGLAGNEIERTDFSKSGVRKMLAEQNSITKEMIVLIKPTDQSKYKNIIDILDELTIAHINQYSLVSITPIDEGLIKKAN